MQSRCSKANASTVQLGPHAFYTTPPSRTPWSGGLRTTNLAVGNASMCILNCTQQGTPSLEKKSNSRPRSKLNPWSKKPYPLSCNPASSYLQEAFQQHFLHFKTSNLSGRKAHRFLGFSTVGPVREWRKMPVTWAHLRDG